MAPDMGSWMGCAVHISTFLQGSQEKPLGKVLSLLLSG